MENKAGAALFTRRPLFVPGRGATIRRQIVHEHILPEFYTSSPGIVKEFPEKAPLLRQKGFGQDPTENARGFPTNLGQYDKPFPPRAYHRFQTPGVRRRASYPTPVPSGVLSS